jgi:hypothetical protein
MTTMLQTAPILPLDIPRVSKETKTIESALVFGWVSKTHQ